MVMDVVNAAEETPGIVAILSRMSCSMRTTRSGSLTCVPGMEMRRVCTAWGAGEAGIHLAQRLEGADHEAGADQQDQRERHLHDDENAARAMAVFALAERAAAAAQGVGKVRARVFEDGNQAEEQSCRQRNDQRECEHPRIDGDVFDARQVRQAGRGKQAERPVGQRQAERAAGRGRAARFPAAVRGRCVPIRRPARCESRVPAGVHRRGPAAGWRRWRRRSTAPCRRCPSAPRACCRYRRPDRPSAAADWGRCARLRTSSS